MKSVFMLSFLFFVFLVFVCKTMYFYLKWCVKKKNTKSQPKKIVCEIVNFGSTKLTKQKKKKFIETQQNDTTFS